MPTVSGPYDSDCQWNHHARKRGALMPTVREPLMLPVVCTGGVEPACQLSANPFVSSYQPRSRFKRLHRIGDCAYKPGGDASTFIFHGFSEPPASEYSKRCGHCFRTATAVVPSSSESASSGNE